ncbi:MAG: phosphatidate cytidylyltransferase [Flavobacteriaceae bacterium]|nr:phosphatidate cytidylyltransferase [Flavobacteriaceae bacterium]
MRKLLTRSVFGLMYGLIISGSLLLSDIAFAFIVLMLGTFALTEFHKLIDYFSVLPAGGLAIVLYFDYINQIKPSTIEIILILILLVHLGLFFFLLRGKSFKFFPLFKLLISTFYVAAPCFLLFLSTDLNQKLGSLLTLSFLMLVWINDSAAYLIGSTFGKRKLSVNISPNKTWEGTIGGFTLTVLAGLIAYHFQSEYPLWFVLITAAIISGLATLGDLIASKFKRLAEVKDSGNILPGHGGIYDRMDSILFSITYVYLILMV